MDLMALAISNLRAGKSPVENDLITTLFTERKVTMVRLAAHFLPNLGAAIHWSTPEEAPDSKLRRSLINVNPSTPAVQHSLADL